MGPEPVVGQVPDDFTRSPDQADEPAVHELENAAMDPRGVLLDAMRALAP